MLIKCVTSDKTQADMQQLIDLVPVHKLERMREVLRNRTRHLTVVTEELHHAHNASAIMRTAERFGIQDMHAIQARNSFCAYTGIARGSYKWMTLHQYRSSKRVMSS